MSNYKFGAKGEGKGKVVYNAGIINGIVALAINEVEGVRLVSGKRRGISLFPEKDGVYADVSVRVHYGHNVPELAYRIQQSIKQNVETMVKAIGFSDAVVTVSSDFDSVNVFIDTPELTYDSALSIYTTLKNETGISPEKIRIVPINSAD